MGRQRRVGHRSVRGLVLLLTGPAACLSVEGSVGVFDSAGGATGAGGGSSGASGLPGEGMTSGGSDGASASDEGGDSPIFDVGSGPGGPGGDGAPSCKVPQGAMNAPGACNEKAPPNSFEPVEQWSWGQERESAVIVLVANFTDDNGDGTVDLCDTPDVLVTHYAAFPARLTLLDGATGAEHWSTGDEVHWHTTPAIGDIDDDGLVEIVTVDDDRYLVAYEHDGSFKWRSSTARVDWGRDPTGWPNVEPPGAPAVALADLDHDGDVEIVAQHVVADHEGNLLWKAPKGKLQLFSASVVADLDGDDDMEVLVGQHAYHHDGSVYYEFPGGTENVHGTYPQVADLDEDGLPEVVVAFGDGVYMLEHDGAKAWGPFGGGSSDSNRPIAIHDFDGDGRPEFAASALQDTRAFGVFEPLPSQIWLGPHEDASGQSGGTAFDFLGSGIAQAVYADEQTMWVHDESGQVLMQTARKSGTVIEYPVVADLDNDGAAEIAVVSNRNGNFPGDDRPAVTVYADANERWIRARRIWNQHTYHVTNVREDGTIPEVEPKHWKLLNTFRTQAQIEDGGSVCSPVPAG